MKFNIYYNGQLQRTVVCSESDIQTQLAPGEKYTTQDYTSVDEPSNLYKVGQIKARRDQMLTSSDWTQVSDNALTEAQRAAWRVYRQALRDISSQPDYPFSVAWPVPPS